MEQKTAETLKSLAVTTINSVRQPVATLSGGQRQSVAVAKAVQWNSKLVILDEPTAALGVAQTEQVLALVRPPRRAGPRGRAHLAQPARHLRDGHRITVLRLGRNVGIFERAKTTQQEVVEAITAGMPTKVSGIPAAALGAADVSTTDVEVVGQDAAPPPEEKPRGPPASSGAAGTTSKSGNLGVLPLVLGLDLHRRLLQLQGDELLHGPELHQRHHPDGRDGDARLRRRLRPPARRDRPLDQLRRRDRRPVAVAELQLPGSGHQINGLLAMLGAVCHLRR